MFYELPPGSPIPNKKRLPVGSIFLLNGKIYRRGPTRIYSGFRGGMDPTISSAFYKRSQKRRAKGLPPTPYGVKR